MALLRSLPLFAHPRHACSVPTRRCGPCSGPGWMTAAGDATGRALRLGPAALLLCALLLALPAPGWAAPGICVGPVCGDGFSRSAKHAFQLRLRLSDQSGHHERVTVDCRDGRISPARGPVERGYGTAVARRVCRLVG